MQLAYTLYNCAVKGIFTTLRQSRALVRKTGKRQPRTKLDRFIQLQHTWQKKLAGISSVAPGQKTIWFHASSLGEYQIARPVITLLKKKGNYRIIFTFFSSTPIDALKGSENTPTSPDFILPLPLDTKENAEKFIDSIKPDLAIFMVSEFWPNFLAVLKRKHVPTLLYSGLFRDKSPNSLRSRFRNSMVRQFDKVAVHDNTSLEYLNKIGYSNAYKVADPLFDNALSKKKEEYKKDTLKKFCEKAKGKVLVAGSIHIDRDLELIASVAEKYPDTKLIIVPHEITPQGLTRIFAAMPGKTVLYSESKNITDWRSVQCLIVDFIGALAKIYRYGDAAYVGGGFTPLLHSVIEPLVYGIPVAFGPKTGRKYITAVLQKESLGTIVTDPAEICRWWEEIVSGTTDLKLIQKKATSLCECNRGGAETAVDLITKMIQP